MTDSRITAGDISNIVNNNQVIREGLGQIVLVTAGNERKAQNFTQKCHFELLMDDGRCYEEEGSWEYEGPPEYRLDLERFNIFLEDSGLYFANARLLYPAVKVNVFSTRLERIENAVVVGYGDVYGDVDVDLSVEEVPPVVSTSV